MSDEDEIRQAARSVASAARMTRDVALDLRQSQTVSWTGSASQAFRGLVQNHANAVDRAAADVEDLHRRLLRFATAAEGIW